MALFAAAMGTISGPDTIIDIWDVVSPWSSGEDRAWGAAGLIAPISGRTMRTFAARGGQAAARALSAITGAAEDVIVLGRQADTAVAASWPGFKVLNINNWTLARNDSFIATAIERGQNAYLASPLAGNLVQTAGRNAGQPTVFARELGQLAAAGYKQIGNYMVHPKNIATFVAP